VARPESSKGVNIAPTPFEDSGRATRRDWDIPIIEQEATEQTDGTG